MVRIASPEQQPPGILGDGQPVHLLRRDLIHLGQPGDMSRAEKHIQGNLGNRCSARQEMKGSIDVRAGVRAEMQNGFDDRRIGIRLGASIEIRVTNPAM